MKKVRLLLWTLLPVAGVGAFAAHRLGATHETATTGSLGQVPSFELTDQSGRRVADSDLRGRVWVANFVFTRCPSVCPLLTAKFAALQKQLGNLPVSFVSISVDPEHDTPEVLAAYARRFEADPARWRFLTGPLQEIERTVVQGFKVHRGEPQPSAADPTLIEIMHGEHFVLVDAQGEIRGYYRSDSTGLKQLEAELRDLVR